MIHLFRYFFWNLYASVACGFLVVWYAHEPFAGGDYTDKIVTPLQAYRKKWMIEDGIYARNLAIKRTNFYDPDPEESE